MNLKPLGDRILVKPDPVEDQSKGGIILAESAKQKPLKGTVIKIGNDLEHKFETKPGNRILYGQYSGTEVEDEDEEHHLIMREDEIFAIII